VIVKFCSREEAERTPPSPEVAVISITDADADPVALGVSWMGVLRLDFDDVDPGHMINPFTKAAVLKRYSPMGSDQALRTVRYVEGMVKAGAKGFLVHCEHGQSRSAAVAKYIGERYGLPMDEGDLRFHNPHVYRMLKEAEQVP